MTTARLTIYPRGSVAEARELAWDRLVEIGGLVASEASAGAPRLTGRYAASFSVETSEGVRVVSSDDTAIHKEYGTSRTPAHASLTSAAMRHGRYSGTRPRGR